MQSTLRWILVCLAGAAFYTGIRMRIDALTPREVDRGVPAMLVELHAHLETYGVHTHVGLVEVNEPGVRTRARFELNGGEPLVFLVDWCTSMQTAAERAEVTRHAFAQSGTGGVSVSLGHFILTLNAWDPGAPRTREVVDAFRAFPYGHASPPG